MNSVSQECQQLKDAYDECFKDWFKKAFLQGSKTNDCDKLFVGYKACVKTAIEKKGIELWEVEKDVLGTDKEKTGAKAENK